MVDCKRRARFGSCSFIESSSAESPTWVSHRFVYSLFHLLSVAQSPVRCRPLCFLRRVQLCARIRTMALSSLSFLPHLPPDLLQSSVTSAASPACSRPWSLSTSHSWISSERSQFAVVAAKGKHEKMDFEFLDDDGGMEEQDRIPDHITNMEEWMRNRPSGFGVGKAYDLALEEKLLTEIEADKKAREAAKRNKGSNGKMTPKKAKVTEAPAGVEVWVGNLPRKRKVERDLRTVFRSAPGLLHIRPIVEPENEKTREPMCRGFAFFTFDTEDDAYDFVSMYNGVKVKFGKVEKKIACEVAKSDSPWHPKPDRRASSAISVPKLQVRDTDYATESRLPPTPAKKLERELDILTVKSSATSFRDNLFAEEEEAEEEEDEDGGSETELRAMEEEIWDKFEDEDDISLDLELSQNEGLDDEDEPSQLRSAMDDDELSEPVESVRGRNINVEETGDLRVSGLKARESLHEEDVDEEEYSVEKIKALEAKVREMERKLQLSAQNEEERVALLEKRVLSKAKAAVGLSTSKVVGQKKKAGAKKKSQAGKKSQKPKIGSLGSASRLKAKERAILTGVMSKYVSSSP